MHAKTRVETRKEDWVGGKKRLVMELPKREMLEDFAVIGGLVGVQVVYAGNALVLSYLMSVGLNPLSLVVYSAFATFIVLTPLSFYFERSKWPSRISCKLWIQLILISFTGVTLFQSLFLMGIEKTSPAIATAMPNLAPGLIFIIACSFRLEKVNISCMYSQVKIIGTLLCVVGAVVMSLLHSTTEKSSKLSEIIFNEEKIVGCLYLLAAVFTLSSNVVLQATTLVDFPAPISLCAITSIIGVFLTMIVEFLQNHKFDTGWPNLSLRDIVFYSLLGGSVSGLCVSFNGWAMKKRGPVLVSMFSPIGTVCSVILSVMTLGESISIGSLCGMCLMFTGLYFVLWAKGKEGFQVGETLEPEPEPELENDVEKPLLDHT
ncbi:WAT1-related protein At5g47470 [Vitis vinifera]|uniref:WAT1-related protein At5g47470 n=1 Tax=Vitis vinifera TaxID=29760 RepID=UPI00288321FC|nr:WAT1-related protein At5g47470 [Vitis vinifera]